VRIIVMRVKVANVMFVRVIVKLLRTKVVAVCWFGVGKVPEKKQS
jgi:hypothetical protein